MPPHKTLYKTIAGLIMPLKGMRLFCLVFILFNVSLSFAFPAADSQNLEKITLQLAWKYQFEFAGFIAAKEKGFYQEAGLEVELKELSESQDNIVEDVISGKADYAVYSHDIAQLKANTNQPVVFLANYFKRPALVFISRDPYLSPEDFAGKKIMAVDSDINNSSLTLLLDKFNIDRKTLEIIPRSFNPDDVIEAEVDIISAYLSNEIYDFKKADIPFSIIDPAMYGIYSYNNNLFTSQSIAKNHYERTQRFVKASNKGWEYALQHPDEINQIILDHYSHYKTLEALKFEAGVINKLMLPKIYPIGSIDRNFVVNNLQRLNEQKLLKYNFPIDTLFLEYYKPLSLSLTEKEKDFLENHSIITFSNELDWFPFDFTENSKKNGQPMGFSIDYLNLLADKIGIQIQFDSDYWHLLLKKIKNNEIDAMHSIVKIKQREQLLSFTRPFSQINYVLVSHDRSNNEIKSLEDLNGKIIAVAKDWSIDYYIKDNYPEIQMLEVNNSQQMLEAVAYGKADASIDNHQTVSYLIQTLYINNLKISPIQFPSTDAVNLRIAFRKDLKTFVPIFEKAMNSLSVAELQQLNQKWFESDQESFNTNKAITMQDQIVFSEQEKDYLKTKQQITMCIDPDWMPLESFDKNQHIGMTADYYKLLSETINIPITAIKTKSWTETIQKARDRECDILSLAMATPERRTYLDFTQSYLKIPLVIATKINEQFIPDITQIKDRKIGIVRGYAFAEILRKKYPDLYIVDVDSVADGLNKVHSDELFGFIGTLATIGYHIQKEFPSELKIAGKFSQNWELGIATRNDEPLLNSILNKAISTINAEQHQEILNKWVSVQFEKNFNSRDMLIWIAFAFFLISFVLYRNYALKKYNTKLSELSITDKLTQLYNRLKIDIELEKQKEYCNRYNTVFSVILIDLDLFKKVNDNFGHLAGDAVLVDFAKIIRNNIRAVDMAARWGGEEFLIICPNSINDDAVKLAEKLRLTIENHRFKALNNLTASFGVAQYKTPSSINALISNADKALYQAKESGRNRVIGFNSLYK